MYKTNKQIEARAEGMIEFTKIVSKTEKPNFTHDERVLMGTLAANSTGREVGKVFGASQPSVSHYKKGLIGTRVSEELTRDINKNKEIVRDNALDVLLNAIGLTGELIPNVTKAVDASIVAKNMQTIVSNMNGDVGAGVNVGLKIVIEAPNQKSESAYETIDV